MRIFLDANVLSSAALRTDTPLRSFFRLADAGVCDLSCSQFVLDEARRNIAHKSPERSSDLEQLTARVAVCQEGTPDDVDWAHSTGLPEKDAPILAAAARAQADMLVTGDRADFGALYEQKWRGVEILPPRTALERVLDAAANSPPPRP